MPRRPAHSVHAVPALETLEARLLLASDLMISEFMADNSKTLKDKDGAYSDWLEINNTGAAAIDLAGYYLTDSASNLTKWRFPSKVLPAGGYLVVFASNKNITTGTELHTNFRLGAGGDYLALVQPDGHTIAYEYTPQYPQQFSDVSYGIGQNLITKTLVGAGAAAEALIPSSGTLGLTWTNYTFDDTSWTLRGTTGVGFDAPVAGWQVRTFLASLSLGTLGNVTQAESVISLPANRRDPTIYGENFSYINYLNSGTDAHFGSGRNLPGVNPAYNAVTNLVMEATGWITVGQAGLYTFGVNSDDGFSLTITGATTTWKANASTATVGDNLLDYQGGRSAGDTWGAFSFPAAGQYPVRLVWFQGGGGAEVEVFAASGERKDQVLSYADYKLVGDTANGGLAMTGMPFLPAGVTSYAGLIHTDVQAAMYKVNPSAYLRIPFTVTDTSIYNSLALRMKYDDGFVAYLNGVEVARRNAPTSAAWNSAATAERLKADAQTYEEIDISSKLGNLRVGTNVLAIQGLNYGTSNSDFLILPELVDTDIAYADLHYFATATPGAPNLASYYAYVADTKFDHDRGFYTAAFNVAITTATPGATIRYTLDNSAPTATTGLVYTGPIHIAKTTILRAAAFKDGYEPSNADTQTYLFLDDVIHQPPAPAGYPTSWGFYGGSPFPADYEVDPNVVNDPLYAGTIKNDLMSIPTMSIVTSIPNMFGPSGIYSNTMVDGLEVPGSVELINPDGTKGFQANTGVRIYGGWGRHVEYGKHSFRLFFRSEYGTPQLKYDLFGDGATTSFDSLILRANFNDSYVGSGGNAQFMIDEWSRRTQLDMGWPASHGKYVQLYVDGLYWGLYNVAERLDGNFTSDYLGGNPEDYDVIHSGGSFDVIQGNLTAWNTMFSIARSGLASNANYQSLQQYLDVPALVDYVLLNFYGGNWDWDWHNWYAARQRVPGAQFKFFVWDGEGNLTNLGVNIDGRNTSGNPTEIFQALRQNADFRQLLMDRIYKNYFNNGPLTPTAAAARYQELVTMIDRAVVGESARWGDFRGEPPLTRDRNWVPIKNSELNNYFPARSGIELNNLRSAGMYPLLTAGAEAPLYSQEGGNIAPGFRLTMTNPNTAGTIYYTLDGSDPRLAGGGISPNASIYSGAVTLNDSRMVRARVKNGNLWSAIHDVVFLTPTPPALRITELMFHPPNPDPNSNFGVDDFEFIEVQNIGASPLDIGGMKFADGVDFTFPSMTLPAGTYTVVVSNIAAFRSRYGSPGISVAGQWLAGNLKDSGERILLEGKFGEPILDFTYANTWYSASDGDGYSLNIINPLADQATWGLKTSWMLSNYFGGSPGMDNSGLMPGSIAINELLAHTDADPRMDWVELKNTTDQPVDIGGWYLSDTPLDLKKYRIASGTILQPGQLLLLTQRDNFGNPADPGYRTPFGYSEYGETVCLTSADAAGNLLGYREQQDVEASDREVPFARYVTSTGNLEFVAEDHPTPLAENAPPKVGPVVISEVMYHPLNDADEFVELHNITGAAVALYDPAIPANTWQIGGGISYTFASGLSIPAGGYLLLVNTDPALFRAKYGVPAGVQIVGPFTGLLNNAGENVRLYKPGDPDPLPPYQVPYYLVDRVEYKAVAPWPTQPDGYGPSLQRLSNTAYGNDPLNWGPGPDEGTPGVANGSADVTPPRMVSATTTDGDSIHITVEFNEALDPVTSRIAANYTIPGVTVSSVAPGPNDRVVVLTTLPMTNGLLYTVTAAHVKNAAGFEIGIPNQAQFTCFGSGAGLWGQYYQYPPGNINWLNPKVARLDPAINFDWFGGSPDPLLLSDLFSVRWTGKVKPLYSENYTFYTISEDGVRLWVNGQLLIDHWTEHPATEDSATIALASGQKYDIKVEYYENTGSASMKLFWSSPSTSKQIVPTALLFCNTNPPVSLPDGYGAVTGIPLTVSAADGVLANDADPNDFPLTAILRRRVSHGSVTLRPDGSFTYTPTAGYEGPDTFSYKANNGLVDGLETTVSLLVEKPPAVTAVAVNEQADRSVSSIDPTIGGVRQIDVTFSKPVLFLPDDLLLQQVTFNGNSETVVATIPPFSVFGLGSSVMQIILPDNAALDTWLKVTLKGNGMLRCASGNNLHLDGEAKAGGTGRSYIYGAADLPTGNGAPGGNAVFYVGNLRGDFSQVGGAPGGDGRISVDDTDGFFAKFQASNREADFSGVGFGPSAPDGQITPWDLDAFIAFYNQRAAQGTTLPALPNPGPQAGGEPGPLAEGSPQAVTLAPSAAPTDAAAPLPDAPPPDVPPVQLVVAAETLEVPDAGARYAAPLQALVATDVPLSPGEEILLAAASVALVGADPGGAAIDVASGPTEALPVPTGLPLAWAEAQTPATGAEEPVLSPDGGVDLLAAAALQLPLGA